MSFQFDPNGEGFQKVLKDYQVETLNLVWKRADEGVISREAWQHVNEAFKGEKTVSRASIINFLNDMVDNNVLDYKEESGKGGYHRVYFPKLDDSGYKKYIARTVIESLWRDFPEETLEAAKTLDLS
jgi:hypothetical protein